MKILSKLSVNLTLYIYTMYLCVAYIELESYISRLKAINYQMLYYIIMRNREQ